MPSVFLSHSHADKPFVRKLASALVDRGVVTWIDEAELNIGDSLIERISSAIQTCDFIAAVLSKNSIASAWVQKELYLAVSREIKGKRVVVLPVVIDECEIPSSLLDKYYADFKNEAEFNKSFELLLRRIQPATLTQPKKLTKVPPQPTPKTHSAVTEFEDLKVVGIDQSKTRQTNPEKQLFEFYFELSAFAPNVWSKFFEQSRSFPRHNMWRKAWVSGNHVVVYCAPDEIKKYHLADIKKDVETANQGYRKYLIEREEEALRHRQAEERKNRELSTAIEELDFS